MFIRPVHKGEVLISLALARTNGDILVDSDIVEHFDLDTTGKEIKKNAQEFFGVSNVEWGKPIQI